MEFYRDALGLSLVRGDPASPLVVFQSGRQTLGILDREKVPAWLVTYVGSPSGTVVLVVTTEDVDAAYERLAARGVTYVVEPKEFPDWGVRSSVCQDPEGNLIEIVSLPAVR